MKSDRESTDNFILLVYDKIEDYDKVIDTMKEKIHRKPVLRQDERNFLFVAYDSLLKKKVHSIDAMNKKLKALPNNEITENDKKAQKLYSDKLNLEEEIDIIQNYKRKIIKEHNDICLEVINLITNTLLPNAKSEESIIFYFTKLGRYYSYIYNYSTEQEQKDVAKNVVENFEKAIKDSQKSNLTFNRYFVENVLFYTSFLADKLGKKDKARELCSKIYSDLVADEMIRQEHIKGISISVLSDKISQLAR